MLTCPSCIFSKQSIKIQKAKSLFCQTSNLSNLDDIRKNCAVFNIS